MNKVTMRPVIYIGWLTIAAAGCTGLVEAPDEGLDNPTVVAVCTSASYWKNGDKITDLMNPGGECNGCHEKEKKGPIYTAAGTVYPTLHEPDDCNGANGVATNENRSNGVKVIITDGQNRDLLPIEVNSVGNFHYPIPIIMPFHVRVVGANGKENAMKASPPSADCNSCHKQYGLNGAPGRITVPQ